MIKYASMNRIGDRDNNEDNLSASERNGRYVFCVADGLGGHDLGEVASQIAAETFQVNNENNIHSSNIHSFLESSFEEAQDEILNEQEKRFAREKMKTTVVTLVLDGEDVCWGHIGDSRLYAFRWNKICERTLDHSVPQMLVQAREIKEKDIRHHPDRNRLLRVMGAKWGSKKYEISPVKKMKRYQAFLLCTDGFWELIDEKMMCKYLKKANMVDEWLQLMESEVLKNGKASDEDMDNYTAIAVWV